MGIMPHTDIDKALTLALSLDIPFWPQLPNVSYYEDMYVQASEGFPGLVVDVENKKMRFDRARFDNELGGYSERMNDAEYFVLSPDYSRVYHRFLQKDLSKYTAIRGQNIGPVSFGFRVTDNDNRPIIYDDGIRSLVFDFFQKKINVQYRELVKKNKNAFVWLDEPGLGWVFSGLSGFNDMQAKQEYRSFLDGLEGIKSLHLCANVNLPYLLSMGTGLLSFDAYQLELMPKGYAQAVADFLVNGGIICWGIVPTDSVNLSRETPESLVNLLMAYWEVVAANSGVTIRQIAEQALIAPARCCLKNIGKVGAAEDAATCSIEEGMTAEEQLVERAFNYLKKMSATLRNKYGV
jgi:hypothetical protein